MTWGERPESESDADERLRLTDLRKLARRSRRRLVSAARADDRPTFPRLLGEHLGSLPDAEVVEETWAGYDHVNVQVGLEAWLAGAGRSHRLVGLVDARHTEFGLTDLMRPDEHPFGVPRPGQVTWTNLSSGPHGETHAAVKAGLYLVEDGDAKVALLLLSGDSEMGGMRSGVSLQVVTDAPGRAQQVAAEVRASALRHNVFRGQVVSFGTGMFERSAALGFHARRTMTSDEVILPTETMDMIRRQVVGVAEHRERLLAARQHLKRGLLLYGPPGTGKTHTLRWLIGQLTGVTVVELTGESIGMIGTACSLARALQPSMVVVEDVDLVAQDRDEYDGAQPLLFELLNEMDGLDEDADVVFVLTTNRAEALEPALAARPGRVDQAVALELPDAEARRRLFTLYRGDLRVDESRFDDVLARTADVTASFLKELLRRSALIAASAAPEDTDSPLSVSADQLDEALAELLDTRNAMTRVLLGGQAASPPDDEH